MEHVQNDHPPPASGPVVSDAAVKLVAACTHPLVKGATRRFFTAVATHVPEGQTTTPPLTLPELAHDAQHTPRTAQTCRNLLEGLGLVAVHDGGRGNKARYEVLHLDGAPPPRPVPLPLRADLREAPRTIKERSTSEISGDQTAINVGSDVRADLHQHRKFFLRYWSSFVNVGNHFLRLAARTINGRSTSEVPGDQRAINVGNQAKEQRQTSDPTFAFEAPSSSSYVRSSLDLVVVGGSAAAPSDDAMRAWPPDKVLTEAEGRAFDAFLDRESQRPAVDAFLDWFEAAYPARHYGAICRVNRAKDALLVLELLKLPGHDLAHLKAMTNLLWAIKSDGVVRSHPWWIAERVTVRNIFILHRKAEFLDQEVRRRAAEESARGDVWAQVLAGLATRITQHAFQSWWTESRLVADRGSLIVVQLVTDPTKYPLFHAWIQKHYAGALADSLAAVRPGARVEFIATARDRKSG